MQNTQGNSPQIIKTIGEQGEEIFMKLQEIVNVEGQDYALLSLVEEDTLPLVGNNDDDEVVLMKMIQSEEECTFEIIEDDEEFELVAQAITDEDMKL